MPLHFLPEVWAIFVLLNVLAYSALRRPEGFGVTLLERDVFPR